MDGRRVDSFVVVVVDDVVVDVCGSERRKEGGADRNHQQYAHTHLQVGGERGGNSRSKHAFRTRTKVLTPSPKMRMYRRRASK